MVSEVFPGLMTNNCDIEFADASIKDGAGILGTVAM
jgi:hypothetical protein